MSGPTQNTAGFGQQRMDMAAVDAVCAAQQHRRLAAGALRAVRFQGGAIAEFDQRRWGYVHQWRVEAVAQPMCAAAGQECDVAGAQQNRLVLGGDQPARALQHDMKPGAVGRQEPHAPRGHLDGAR